MDKPATMWWFASASLVSWRWTATWSVPVTVTASLLRTHFHVLLDNTKRNKGHNLPRFIQNNREVQVSPLSGTNMWICRNPRTNNTIVIHLFDGIFFVFFHFFFIHVILQCVHSRLQLICLFQNLTLLETQPLSVTHWTRKFLSQLRNSGSGGTWTLVQFTSSDFSPEFEAWWHHKIFPHVATHLWTRQREQLQILQENKT